MILEYILIAYFSIGYASASTGGPVAIEFPTEQACTDFLNYLKVNPKKSITVGKFDFGDCISKYPLKPPK